jgi:two-component system phosphate regulon sensor histidine kinase PhoR
LPALKLRHPLSFALRAPDVLDGIEAPAEADAEAETSEDEAATA